MDALDQMTWKRWEKPSSSMYDSKETIAGGFGALCCAYSGEAINQPSYFHPLIASFVFLSGNPFDVIKIRLQTQSELYQGPLNCFKRIFMEEGVLAFWKGVTPALGSAFIENSILFTANGILKRQYLLLRDTSDELTSFEVACLGGLSGICSATV
jgi:hypothetical protein